MRLRGLEEGFSAWFKRGLEIEEEISRCNI